MAANRNRIAIGLSADTDALRLVRIRRIEGGIQVLEASSYKLDKSLDVPREAGGGAEIAPQAESDNVPDVADFDESEVIDLDPELEESGAEEEFDMMDLEETPEADEAGPRDDAGVFVEILQKARQDKARIGITVMEPQVFYNVFETDWDLKGKKLRSRILSELASVKPEYASLGADALSLVHMTEDRLLSVTREFNLELIDRMDRVKSFVGGRLPTIAFVESLESSLVNLARARGDVPDDTVTAILHVGPQASRFFFLKGPKIHHIGALIPDGAESPAVATTLTSRMLLELDSLDIQEVDQVLLSGLVPERDMREMLQDRLSPEVPIERLVLDDLDIGPLLDDDPSVDLTPYAAAMGAALRCLNPERSEWLKVDLTPTHVKEGQNALQLSTLGWILLPLIPILAGIIFLQVNNYERKIVTLQAQLEPRRFLLGEFQALQDSIQQREGVLRGFERSTSVLDSLVVGSDRYSRFLDHLMGVTRDIGGFWFTELSSGGGDLVNLHGYSVYRNRIPELVDSLKNGSLERVEVQDIREKRVYRFHVRASLP